MTPWSESCSMKASEIYLPIPDTAWAQCGVGDTTKESLRQALNISRSVSPDQQDGKMPTEFE